MADLNLTPEDLLAGALGRYDVTIPAEILNPSTSSGTGQGLTIQLKPLTIGAFQLIMKAAKNDAGLIPLLMIKESLVAPVMSLEQVRAMHLGLVNFLIANIREISGLAEKKSP